MLAIVVDPVIAHAKTDEITSHETDYWKEFTVILDTYTRSVGAINLEML